MAQRTDVNSQFTVLPDAPQCGFRWAARLVGSIIHSGYDRSPAGLRSGNEAV